jgi:hypothetical protein
MLIPKKQTILFGFLPIIASFACFVYSIVNLPRNCSIIGTDRNSWICDPSDWCQNYELELICKRVFFIGCMFLFSPPLLSIIRELRRPIKTGLFP